MKFILLIKSNRPAPTNLSPAEIGAIVEKYSNWAAKLRGEGRLVDAEGLKMDGRLISGETGVITDGPFVETKEMVGGYYIYTADSLDEATEIAKGCPTLEMGGYVELRAVMDYD